MIRYAFSRLLWAIPTLLALSLLVFLLLHLTPGDPAQLLLGERASKEAVEKLRRELGLDQPLHIQYVRFLLRVLQGDLGTSITSGEPVLQEFLSRFPATVELSLAAMLIALPLGILLGTFAASKRHTLWDTGCVFISLAGVSIPVFWLGLLLIYLFSVTLGWLPTSGRISIFLVEFTLKEPITGLYLVDSLLYGDLLAFRSALRHLVLPALALSTIPLAIIARITRASLLEILEEDYIKVAYAKGCSPSRVMFLHALPNALIPVTTVTGLMLGTLLAGAVLTETTFSWPGIGKWLVKAVEQRDYPVIQGGTLLLGGLYIALNLAVDLTYRWLNPQVELS